MRIRPQFLRFMWEEDVHSVPATGAVVPEETTGVPALLRRAARWSAIAVVGAALLGQVIGVRLIAPVDAQPGYPAQCRQACINSLCAGKKGRAYLQCYTSKAVANCCAQCNTP